MANPFREAAAAHAAAVDSVYGERLLVEPQGAGVAFVKAGADPARPARMVVGTVTRRPLVVQRVGDGANSSENVTLAGARWLVGFDAVLGLDLRPGDRVTRLDEPGGPVLRLHEAQSIAGRTLHPASEV